MGQLCEVRLTLPKTLAFTGQLSWTVDSGSFDQMVLSTSGQAPCFPDKGHVVKTKELCDLETPEWPAGAEVQRAGRFWWSPRASSREGSPFTFDTFRSPWLTRTMVDRIRTLESQAGQL